MLEWIYQTSWYIITITMVLIFIAWDITGTRKDEGGIDMYKLERIKAHQQKTGILLSRDSKWIIDLAERLVDAIEFYGNEENYSPVQYGSVIETEIERDGGERAREILKKIEKEED